MENAQNSVQNRAIENAAMRHARRRFDVVISVSIDEHGICLLLCNARLSSGIGLCGEPCPTKCRLCHRQIVEQYFYGNEDQPQVRFVLLPDCDHICKTTRSLERVAFTPSLDSFFS